MPVITAKAKPKAANKISHQYLSIRQSVGRRCKYAFPERVTGVIECNIFDALSLSVEAEAGGKTTHSGVIAEGLKMFFDKHKIKVPTVEESLKRRKEIMPDNKQ